MHNAVLAISKSDNVLALRARTLEAFAQAGWDAAYFIAPLVTQRSQRLMVNAGFPDEWEAAYRAGLNLLDPFPDIAGQLGQPFAWHQLDPAVRLSSEDEAYVARLAEWGMQAGVGIATYGPGARAGFVGIGLPQSPVFAAAPALEQLRIIAQTSFLRYCDFLTEESEPATALSIRELDVLRLIANGKTKPTIAKRLGISKSTVDTYIRRIYEKLGVSDRAAAVAKAVSSGVLLATDATITESMRLRQRNRRKPPARSGC